MDDSGAPRAKEVMLYTLKGVAKITGLSLSDIKHHRQIGTLKPTFFLDNKPVFTEDDIREFQEKKRPARRPPNSQIETTPAKHPQRRRKKTA